MVAWTKESELIVAAPVDYLSWTARIAERAEAAAFAAPKRSLWLTGPASARARAEFETRGWKVHENVVGVAEPGV